MAKVSISTKRTKSGVLYSFRGNLEDCIIKCERDLKKLTAEIDFEKRIFKIAKTRYDKFLNNINKCKDFIELGKKELEKQLTLFNVEEIK